MYSELDLKIIDELQKDSRQGNILLAKKLGVSKATISRRVKSLIDKGFIRFTIIRNPPESGFVVSAYMFIDTDADKVEEVADTLAKIDAIPGIAIVTGNFNIVAVGYYKSLDDAWEVQKNEVMKIPGVRSVRTEIILKRVKRPY